MLYIIDHNDSFTYNLVAQIQKYCELCVINVSQIHMVNWENTDVSGVILSPGPKSPDDYPETKKLFLSLYQKVPFIGVCLGHQMIASYLGGSVIKGEKPVQGFVHEINFKEDEAIFKEITQPLLMTRYHSLFVETLPAELEAIGWSLDGVIQIVKHTTLPIYSVQFHPESCGSENGDLLMYRILKEVGLCS